MKIHLYILLVWVILYVFDSQAQQKIGLVLSGGGAKGLAHIGVLKALEEHNIPIDYIMGTSMGAIVAGYYASGYSPEMIEEIVLSKSFMDWIEGKLEKDYQQHIYKERPNTAVRAVDIKIDSTFNLSVNSTLANDVVLNFTLINHLANASYISNNNFDNLFIPTRIIAADIFREKVVVLKDKSLPLAVRASFTVPFFYKPIKIEGKYLFDGGIYNNFPVDIMKKEFNPDVIVGSNVGTNVYKEYPSDNAEALINNRLITMVINKSDPSKLSSADVYIEPNLSNLSAFDFGKAKAIIDSGYTITKKSLKELTTKIGARRSNEEITAKRKKFNSNPLPLSFSKINIYGFNSKQEKYIRNQFKKNTDNYYSFENIKKGYFHLVSDDYFHSVYLNIKYDNTSLSYIFEIYGRPKKTLSLEIGGAIANKKISQIYLGLEFYRFRNYLLRNKLTFQTGTFLKSFNFKSQLFLTGLPKLYLEPEFTINKWNYIKSHELFFDHLEFSTLIRSTQKMSLNFGYPITNKITGTINLSSLSFKDTHIEVQNVISNNNTSYSGEILGFEVLKNDLDDKQYPKKGSSLAISVKHYVMNEFSRIYDNELKINRNYQQFNKLSISWKHYISREKWTIGYTLNSTYSSQKFFNNYIKTIVNLPSFFPRTDSRTLILKNFRAFSFFAIGIENIFEITKSLDFRLNGYIFKPFEVLSDNNITLNKNMALPTKVHFAGNVSLTMNSLFGPINLSLNYYDDPDNMFDVLFHIGFLIYDKEPLE